MIFDLLYCLDLSPTDTILWVSGANRGESTDATAHDRFSQISYLETDTTRISDCDLVFFDLPKQEQIGMMPNRDPKLMPPGVFQRRIIWQINAGFWARKVLAPVFNLKDRKLLTKKFVAYYRNLLPDAHASWETTQSLYVFRFNEDALMLSESDLFLSRFEVWSGNSRRNRLVALFLQCRPIRVFVRKHWPFKILVQKTNAILPN
jgi:hypothetical protein